MISEPKELIYNKDCRHAEHISFGVAETGDVVVLFRDSNWSVCAYHSMSKENFYKHFTCLDTAYKEMAMKAAIDHVCGDSKPPEEICPY